MRLARVRETYDSYLELTKPNITLMVAVTALVGYIAGSGENLHWLRLWFTLTGTMLVAAGTSALNQVLEWRIDRRMKRTQNRPIPAGRIQPAHGAVFGGAISFAGIVLLATTVNLLTAMLAALTLISYVFIYTPMKRRSVWSTVVGAVPGALPPVGGWAAARGDASLEAWLLFAILFFWQLPHFFAIAWLYREDYRRGGLRVLPLLHDGETATARQILWNSVALAAVSLLPASIGMAGSLYAAGAVLLGIGFLYPAAQFGRTRNNRGARQVLLASVAYLPLLLLLLALDVRFF